MGNEQYPDRCVPYQAGAEVSPEQLSILKAYAEALWSRAQESRSPACFSGHVTVVDGMFVTAVPERLANAPLWKRSDIQLGYNVDNELTISYREGRRSRMRADDQTWLREINTYPLVSGASVKRTVQRTHMLAPDCDDSFLSVDQYDLGPITPRDIDALMVSLSILAGESSKRPGHTAFATHLLGLLLRRKANKNGTVGM